MAKPDVYTLSNTEDIGAFHEDALSADDFGETSGASVAASDDMIADLLDSMRRLSICPARRKEIGSQLL
ncbi:hypothetical protein [Massilia timonae]|uniref:hypothetical protein n=1 Tax=Massilia timonae TaxID=47229 RepID=UPI002899C36E|nr:hypothetical protein [Massilia timonae]